MTLRKVVEALIFASPKPITSREIVSALKSATEFSDEEAVLALAKTKAVQVEEVLREMQRQYLESDAGFALVEQASGWQVVSQEACAVWVRQLFPENKPARLSPPSLETLAIIAYRQPITRADIEAVRGVAVDGVMGTLQDRGLVKIAGRADVPGRPLLYETTQFFLEHFGLKNLDELPNASELRQIKLPSAQAPAPPAENPQADLPLAGDADIARQSESNAPDEHTSETAARMQEAQSETDSQAERVVPEEVLP